MYKIDLTFHELPPSLNKTLRKHWTGQRKVGKAWDQMVAIAVAGKLPPEPLPFARITIVRHFWASMDYDGVVGSMKPVVDALVTAGVLSDDRWKVTGPWIVDQVFRAKKDGPMLTVRVESRDADGRALL